MEFVYICDGLYKIYRDGRIYSFDRMVPCKNGYRVRKGKFLKHRKDSGGYVYVSLTNSLGISKNFRIHRLLMICFNYVPGYENLVVNHIDGLRSNNSLSNLEWCTSSENSLHSFKNNLRGFQGNYNDYTEAIKFLKLNGWSNAKIARAFNKNPETIGSILKTMNICSKRGIKGGVIFKT